MAPHELTTFAWLLLALAMVGSLLALLLLWMFPNHRGDR